MEWVLIMKIKLTITREIYADGGSIARINSRATTISVLKEIGGTLINIHGQHVSDSSFT